MTALLRFIRLILLVLLALPAASMSQDSAPAEDPTPLVGDPRSLERIRTTIEFMSSRGSRVSGYPGSREASDYVEDAFRRLGVGDVRREEFEITVPLDLGASLIVPEWGETEIELHGLWPNLVRTPSVPVEGIDASLVYAASGEYGSFDGIDLAGTVVLMEFNSWDHWLRLAALGARAIIFIEPEKTSFLQSLGKTSDIPLNLPRFWIDREDGLKLRRRLLGESPASLPVRLHSRMDWKRRPAWNIWGTIPGQDAELASEVIVVEAYYDGMSVVPARAPAAEMASSVACLLELAEHLQRHPPGRTVILLATGAHFLAHRGVVDFLDRHARKLKYYAQRMEEPLHPALFISLDLSSQTDQIGIWNNTLSFNLKRFFVPFGRRFTRYAEEEAPRQGREAGDALVNGISPIKGMDWSSFVPLGVSVNGQTALLAGQLALSFVTVHDARFAVNTPLDVAADVQLENLQRQSAFLNAILTRAFDDAELLSDLEEFELKDNMRTYGVKVRALPRRSQIPDRKIPGALVVLEGGVDKGVQWSRYFLSDWEGNAQLPGLRVGGARIGAYALDPASGDIIYAPDLGKGGEKFHGKPLGSGSLTMSVRWDYYSKQIVVFPCISKMLFSLVDPVLLFPEAQVKIIDSSGRPPRQFGYLFGLRSASCVIFAPREESSEDARLKILVGGELLINSPGGADEKAARGSGYDLKLDALVPTGLLAVRDMWRLNEARLQTMRRHAIENQKIARLHESGRRLIERASEAMEEHRWSDYVAYIRAAGGVTRRAYPDVVGTLNDVMQGMIFFLALVIPAAFFAERLFIASADIRYQLTGFGLFLFVIWIVISQIHPAFDIAHPLVILLAFAIMAMAVFVLLMVTGRFNRYMREYQARQAQVHETDISRVGAAYAAFTLGISNMRRRRLRSALTLFTLTLLTFTVLSFTSFRPDVRFLVFPLPDEGSYEGVLIRNRGWNGLREDALNFARSHFQTEGVVSPRNWYISSEHEERKYVEVRSGDLTVRATGLLGLTPQEREITGIDRALSSGTFFDSIDERSCLLSQAMAASLGIGADEVGGNAQVQVFGRSFLVRGIFDPVALDAVRDLDHEPLTPVDFKMSAAPAMGPGESVEMTVIDPVFEFSLRPFVHLEPDNILILPYKALREAGGNLRSVAVKFSPDAAPRTLVEDFLTRVDITLFAGLRDQEDIDADAQADISSGVPVYSYTSLGVTSIEGVSSLLVPMSIAALIVLNAMLGAVYERFREIAIYSSVGLAPTHIAMLFIAEACVYAVMGVTLGYITGQGLGKIIVHYDLVRGMNLNYSSMAAIFSSVMVMAVVLLSTVYPARVAARAAVPDTVRRWRPPPPAGDRWEYLFPFMVAQGEALGLCGFLASFFNAYSEESIGSFYAENVRIVRRETEAGSEFAVQMLIWLAPFDMGVSQYLQLDFLPSSDTAGVYRVEVYIHRISGQDTYWQRVNERFVNQLRKEFLLWHTMDRDMRLYHIRAAESMLAETQAVLDGEAEARSPSATITSE
jgi:hypothetical protein